MSILDAKLGASALRVANWLTPTAGVANIGVGIAAGNAAQAVLGGALAAIGWEAANWRNGRFSVLWYSRGTGRTLAPSDPTEPLPDGYRVRVRAYSDTFIAAVERIVTDDEKHKFWVNPYRSICTSPPWEVAEARAASADAAAQKAIRKFHHERAVKGSCEIAEMVWSPGSFDPQERSS